MLEGSIHRSNVDFLNKIVTQKQIRRASNLPTSSVLNSCITFMIYFACYFRTQNVRHVKLQISNQMYSEQCITKQEPKLENIDEDERRNCKWNIKKIFRRNGDGKTFVSIESAENFESGRENGFCDSICLIFISSPFRFQGNSCWNPGWILPYTEEIDRPIANKWRLIDKTIRTQWALSIEHWTCTSISSNLFDFGRKKAKRRGKYMKIQNVFTVRAHEMSIPKEDVYQTNSMLCAWPSASWIWSGFKCIFTIKCHGILLIRFAPNDKRKKERAHEMRLRERESGNKQIN